MKFYEYIICECEKYGKNNCRHYKGKRVVDPIEYIKIIVLQIGKDIPPNNIARSPAMYRYARHLFCSLPFSVSKILLMR